MKVVALLGAVGALASKVTPLEKVISLIEDLQTKVISEGKEEAKTYDKFACFCKDQSKAKNEAISDNEALLETLSADLGVQQDNRQKADDDIVTFTGEMNDAEGEVRRVTEDGRQRRNKYGIEITDMSNAVKALEEAIDVLKSSDKTGAFLAMKSTLRTAAVMAEALGLRTSKAMMQLTDDIPEVPVSDYDFHSNDIIDTLKELLKEFRKTKERVDSEEVTAQQQETKELQGLHDTIEGLKKSLSDANARKSDASDQIGSLSGDMTTATATLNDDRNYLKDLTSKCNSKSDMWDQRTEMRTGELTALTQALVILKDQVSTANKDLGKNLNRFVQESFVQVSKSDKKVRKMLNQVNKRGFLMSKDPRERVMELLRSKSISLKSAVLASLASHAGADPLAKVKKLIEELVLRLQEEAANEANHHGWCVKQTKLAEDKRTTNSKKINNLNGKLAKNEVKRDKLAEQIATLTKEIAELEKSLAEQTQIREDEQTENNQTISDAEDGKKAVEKAIEVLDQFYKAAANGNVVKNDGVVSLAEQQPPASADDMPDAGFDEEYGASQDDSVGIIGMMQVIQSDFDRTISETKKTEKEQAAEFLEFKTTTNSSLAEKNSAKTNYEEEHTLTVDLISSQNQDLDNSIDLRDKAVVELIDLHAACVDTGMSYEERVARREEEIAALKDAYQILSDWKA